MDKLDRVAAELDVRNLVARYGDAIDRRDPAGWGDTWADAGWRFAERTLPSPSCIAARPIWPASAPPVRGLPAGGRGPRCVPRRRFEDREDGTGEIGDGSALGPFHAAIGVISHAGRAVSQRAACVWVVPVLAG